MSETAITPSPRPAAVAITAYQQISGFGCGLQALLQTSTAPGLLDGSSEPRLGVAADYEFYRVSGMQPNAETRQMDELTQVSVACARLMLGTGKLADGERAAIFLGGAFGCHASNQSFIDTLMQKGPRLVKPVVFRNTVSNAVAGHLAIALGITGTNTVVNSGMVGGLQALALACEELRWGHSAVALTGASDWTEKLLGRRYQAQQQGKAGIPLMDGAVLLLLEATETRLPGWYLLSSDLGRLGSYTTVPLQIADSIQRTLDRAGLSFGAVGTLLVNAGGSCCWGRGTRDAEVETLCTMLLEGLPCPPPQESTAVVPLLALVEALERLPRGQAPSLFLPPGAHPHASPGALSYTAVGSDGNLVTVLLEYRPPAPEQDHE